MAITALLSANEIMNRVAAEIGLAPIADPFGSADPAFVRMRYLLNTAGEELVEAHKWEQLTKSHQILTLAGDTGVYDLPDDFAFIINQTGWEHSQNTPIGGGMTAQGWAYVQSRDVNLPSTRLAYRIADGKFNITPAPSAGLDINFEYISKDWVRSATQDPTYTYTDTLTAGEETPLFHRTLITRYLKVKVLEATGFDTTAAQADFNQIFAFITGTEKGAPVLDAGSNSRYPYLGHNNIPDTGFGM